MSFRQDIKNVQAKIKLHLDELEDKVVKSKKHWVSTEVDAPLVEDLMETHTAEILHHCKQIKHHLEKIDYHKKQLDKIDFNLKRCHNKHTGGSKNAKMFSSEIDQIEGEPEEHFKRNEEEKLALKVRRVARSTSLKYVHQWEKMIDQRKEENLSIKRRSKSQNNLCVNEENLSKTIVKNRIQKFEGFQKPKRVSSTIETFLDFSGEKPKRIDSYPILEDPEEEKDMEKNLECESLHSEDLSPTSTDNFESSSLNEEILSVECAKFEANKKKSEATVKDYLKKDVAELEKDVDDPLKPRIVKIHVRQ